MQSRVLRILAVMVVVVMLGESWHIMRSWTEGRASGDVHGHRTHIAGLSHAASHEGTTGHHKTHAHGDDDEFEDVESSSAPLRAPRTEPTPTHPPSAPDASADVDESDAADAPVVWESMGGAAVAREKFWKEEKGRGGKKGWRDYRDALDEDEVKPVRKGAPKVFSPPLSVERRALDVYHELDMLDVRDADAWRDVLANVDPSCARRKGTGVATNRLVGTFAYGPEGQWEVTADLSVENPRSELLGWALDVVLGIGRAPPAVGRALDPQLWDVCWAPVKVAEGKSGEIAPHTAKYSDVKEVVVRPWMEGIKHVDGDLCSRMPESEDFVPPVCKSQKHSKKYSCDVPNAELSDLIIFDYLNDNDDRSGNCFVRDGHMIHLDNGAGNLLPWKNSRAQHAKLKKKVYLRHWVEHPTCEKRHCHFHCKMIHKLRDFERVHGRTLGEAVRAEMKKDPLCNLDGIRTTMSDYVQRDAPWRELDKRVARLMEYVDFCVEKWGTEHVLFGCDD